MSDPWSRRTRDLTFYGVLGVSGLAVLVLLWPFVEVILLAAVAAAVMSDVHERFTVRVGGRRLLAAILLVAGLVLGIAVPLGLVLYRAVSEAIPAAQETIAWVSSPAFETWLAQQRRVLAGPLPAWLRSAVQVNNTAALLDALRGIATTGLAGVSAALPSLMSRVAVGLLDALIFVSAVVTFLADGPRLAEFLRPLLPLDTRYQERLFEVFKKFAASLVVGSVLTSVVQGTLATIGFWVCGLGSAVAWGVGVSLSSFVPVIGTSVVLVPAVLMVGTVHGWGWGLGLGLYGIAVVGTVDNIVRPLVLSGASNVHPLLIFLAVFGGLWWMGLVGLVVGPIVVAFFLALVTIHADDFRRTRPDLD